jgi:hypothetical protein
MRLVSAALAAVLLLGSAAVAAKPPPNPSPTPAPSPLAGPALGAALAHGEIDPAGYDFGALRYAPGRTLVFLAAQTGAQTAVAAAHGKPNWPAVVAARVCLTPAEQMTFAGFDSALLAPDAAGWAEQKAAAEAAFSRYAAARDAILAGRPSPEPDFVPEAAEVAFATRAGRPELQALYRHRAADQLWRHSLVFGAAESAAESKDPRTYAEGIGKAGAVWLNARLATDGCAIDAAAAAWLKQALAGVAWFDIKTYGKDADQAAWLIAEHADGDPEAQRLALDRMGAAVVDKQSDAANFAFLWDRVALNSGRPQRYGTQMRCVGRTWTPVSPVEDLSRLDERRRWVGLPPEDDYARSGAKVCGG